MGESLGELMGAARLICGREGALWMVRCGEYIVVDGFDLGLLSPLPFRHPPHHALSPLSNPIPLIKPHSYPHLYSSPSTLTLIHPIPTTLLRSAIIPPYPIFRPTFEDGVDW